MQAVKSSRAILILVLAACGGHEADGVVQAEAPHPGPGAGLGGETLLTVERELADGFYGFERTCIAPEQPSSGLVEPELAWERISRFLFDEVREPLQPLPEVTTLDAFDDPIELLFREIDTAGQEVPAGVIAFMRAWAFSDAEGSDEASWFWADTILNQQLPALFVGARNDEPRSSVLLEPAFLRAHPTVSQRGAFISSRLLCQPVLAIGTTPRFVREAGETSREALERTTAGTACRSCHRHIDALGAALSAYDAAGNQRESEDGLPIDASGTVVVNGSDWAFEGHAGLALTLADSPEVMECVTRQMFDHAVAKVRGSEFQPFDAASEAHYAAWKISRRYFAFSAMVAAVIGTPSFLSAE